MDTTLVLSELQAVWKLYTIGFVLLALVLST
jgi:hypothetical protein